jgi:hypothetical protein
MQFKGFDLSQRNHFVQNKKGIYFSLTITTKLTAQVLHANVFLMELTHFRPIQYWFIGSHRAKYLYTEMVL